MALGVAHTTLHMLGIMAIHIGDTTLVGDILATRGGITTITSAGVTIGVGATHHTIMVGEATHIMDITGTDQRIDLHIGVVDMEVHAHHTRL